MFFYSLLMVAVFVVGSPYWLYRMATSGRYRAGLGGRLGRVPARLQTGERPVVWVHAVSVGEVLAGLRLIAEMEAALPGYSILLSTTTQTGQELATQRLGAGRVFYFPLDLGFAVRRYLDALRPQMLVLLESELWPRVLAECAVRNIPVVVVNARVSDRSLPRYLSLKRLWRPLLAKVTLFLTQDEENARRLVQVGAPKDRVRSSGNLKYDVSHAGRTALTGRIAPMLIKARLLLAGSTLEGEEEALLAAWPTVFTAVPDAVLLLAPRHPQRFEEVEELLRANVYPFFHCSQLRADEPIFPGTVLLLDTIGDLASMYEVGTVAFVGGSLVDGGGHNPLEPARFGVPVVMGGSYQNFRGIVQAMQDANAIRIVAKHELGATCVALMQDDGGTGERGRTVFAAQAGATARTVQALVDLLGARKGAA